MTVVMLVSVQLRVLTYDLGIIDMSITLRKVMQYYTFSHRKLILFQIPSITCDAVLLYVYVASASSASRRHRNISLILCPHMCSVRVVPG